MPQRKCEDQTQPHLPPAVRARYAAENGHVEVLKLLIEAGADHRALTRTWSYKEFTIPGGKSALELAERNGHTEVADYLRGLRYYYLMITKERNFTGP